MWNTGPAGRDMGLRAELEESEDVEQERCFRVRGHTEAVRLAEARSCAKRDREYTHRTADW